MNKTNKLLELTDRIYDLTGGLCRAVAGPMEIHIGHNSSMHSSPISLSLDVLSYDEMSKLKPTDYLDIKTIGYHIDTRTLVTKDDITNLQKDATPDTQTMLNALLELREQKLTVTLQDFMDAFEVIIERDMTAALGYNPKLSPTNNSETETLNQNTQEVEVDMEDTEPTWGQKMY